MDFLSVGLILKGFLNAKNFLFPNLSERAALQIQSVHK